MMTPFKNEAEYYGFDPRECATAIADLFNALDQRYETSNEPLTAGLYFWSFEIIKNIYK